MINRYNRFFITLNQEISEYSIKNEKAVGRCIIESQDIKGKVTFNVQNLRNEFSYKAFIVAENNGSYLGINIGEIQVNEKGKANLRWECNAYDVANTGINLNNFKIATILINNSKNDLKVALVGYKNGEVTWKNNFKEYKEEDNKESIIEKKETNIEETKDNIHNLEEDIKKSKIDEKIKNKEEKIFLEKEEIIKKNLENIDDNYRNFVNDSIKIDNLKEEEENIYNSTDSIHETFKSMAKKFNEEIKELESYTLGENNTEENLQSCNINRINKELSYMFTNNAKMIPFYNSDIDNIWIRISLKEMVHLSSDFWNLMNSSFVVNAFQKYNHLILGKYKKNNKIRYILGVPEIYCEQDKDLVKRLGFRSFRYCDNIEERKTNHGYWMMDLDIN